VAFINAYNKNLQNEIKSRKAVLASIEAAKKFYEHQGKEVKVVASVSIKYINQYKNIFQNDYFYRPIKVLARALK